MLAVPDSPVSMTSGLGETVLPEPPAEAADALEEAVSQEGEAARGAVSAIVASYPTYLEAWARLGDLARDTVEAYACYRVGYHRGLDALRAAGWRGSGYVRFRHPSNRGFLRALKGLARTAAEIGENHEAQRCEQFVTQLDPEWDGNA